MRKNIFITIGVFLFIRVTFSQNLYSGFIGLKSTYSTGESTVEEYVKVAQKMGIDFIVFTEDMKEMNPEKYQKLVEECKKYSNSSFLAVPGLYFSEEKKEKLSVIAINPVRFPPSNFSVRGLLVEIRLRGYGNYALVIISTHHNTWDPYRIRFWTNIATHTYIENKLTDTSVNLYKNLLQDDYYCSPIVVQIITNAKQLENIAQKKGIYNTFYKGRKLGRWYWMHPFMVSNGPLIKKFNFQWPDPNRRPRNHIYQGERIKLNLEITDDFNLKQVNIYKGNKIWRTFYPNKKDFSISFSFPHEQATRIWVEVEDVKGRKALSRGQWIINREFTGEMCNDNQNNIIAKTILENDRTIDHILVGAWHTGGGGGRLGFLIPSKEITPIGEETGVTSAIWGLNNIPSFYTKGLNWAKFDKICFWMKVKPVNPTNCRWNNKGKWQPPLRIFPKDEDWHFYEMDISNIVRDGVQHFWWYLPTKEGKNYEVWLDEIYLLDKETEKKYLIDRFKDSIKEWKDCSGWNKLSSSDETPKRSGKSLHIEVNAVKNSPTNAIKWTIPEEIYNPKNAPPQLKRILSTNDVNVFKYETENILSFEEAIFTIFKPKVRGWNIVFIKSIIKPKKEIEFSSNVSPQIKLASALGKRNLGPWKNFLLINEKGEILKGKNPEKGIIQNWRDLGRKGIVGVCPHPNGSFGFMFNQKMPILARIENAYGSQLISLGMNFKNILKMDSLLKVEYAFFVGNGLPEDYSDLIKAYDIYGYDGIPSYNVKINHGRIIDKTGFLKFSTSDYYISASVSKTDMPNYLGFSIKNLNPNWSAGIYDMEKKKLHILGIADAWEISGIAYGVLDVSSRNCDFIAGNLVISDKPEIRIEWLGEKNGWVELLVHNPLKGKIAFSLSVPEGFKKLYTIKGKWTLNPGEMVILKCKGDRIEKVK